MKETQPKPVIEQANQVVNQVDPKPETVVVHKNGFQKVVFTDDEETEFIIYTSSVGKKGLGA